MQQPDFYDFSCDPVDFNPITRSNAVWPHQDEPAKETDDEILQRYRQARARKGHYGGHLAWRPKDDQQYQGDSDYLHGESNRDAHRVAASAVRGDTGDNAVHQTVGENNRHQKDDDPAAALNYTQPV